MNNFLKDGDWKVKSGVFSRGWQPPSDIVLPEPDNGYEFM
tara:strand:+ start:366 stop:485 length:120 start_codon:yes stop_codon:yes gene_type:complete